MDSSKWLQQSHECWGVRNAIIDIFFVHYGRLCSQVQHDLIYDKQTTLTCLLEMPTPQCQGTNGSAFQQNVKYLADFNWEKSRWAEFPLKIFTLQPGYRYLWCLGKRWQEKGRYCGYGWLFTSWKEGDCLQAMTPKHENAAMSPDGYIYNLLGNLPNLTVSGTCMKS